MSERRYGGDLRESHRKGRQYQRRRRVVPYASESIPCDGNNLFRSHHRIQPERSFERNAGSGGRYQLCSDQTVQHGVYEAFQISFATIVPSATRPVKVGAWHLPKGLIRGDEKRINEIHRLIDLLDDEVPTKSDDATPPRFPGEVKSLVPQQEIKVFALQYIAAIEAQRILDDLFGKDLVAISADQRVNSLVVRGQADRLAEIEVILKRLDEKPAEIVKQPASDKVQTNGISGPHSNSSGRTSNDFGSPIEAFRRRLNELETPVLELAEKLRSCEAEFGKDHLNSTKLRADLRALVQQSFVARQEIQRAELVEFSRRLQLMQQTIEARDRISEKIVDRRMEELLDPNVGWTQPKRKTPSE